MVSSPTLLCSSTQSDCALMRAEARGPSATLMTSTSFSLQYCARSRICPGSAPLGGSSSTETTNFFPSLRASGLLSSRGMGCGASLGRAWGSRATASRAGRTMRTERTRLRMWAGLVPRGHGLDGEEVHPAFHEPLGLVAVGGHRLVEGDVAVRLEGLAHGPDGSRHQRAALPRLPGDAGALGVDLAHLGLEPVRAEL